MGKSAPAAPDYTAAARASGESSKEVTNMQTWANRPTQITPWGTTSWEADRAIDPATRQPVTTWTQTQTLDPDSQAALDSQLGLMKDKSELASGMMGRLESDFSDPMDWQQFGQMQGGVNAEDIDRSTLPEGVYSVDRGENYRQQAEDALYGRRTSRLDPMFDQRQQALEIKLANQGLSAGDEAYDDAMANFGRERTDAYDAAMQESIMGGGAEASRMLDMDLAAGNFANTARGQYLGEEMGLKDRRYLQSNQEADRANAIRTAMINEEMMRRGTNLNEMNAIMSGQQVQTPVMPSYNMASKAQPVDYMGAASSQYSAALDAYNAKQMGLQGMMGGIGGIAQAGMGFF